MPSLQDHLDNYYKFYNLAKIPNKSKVLKNQELYQLYKVPKKDTKDQVVHFDTSDIAPKAIFQADCLYLPDDKGYKFCLVVPAPPGQVPHLQQSPYLLSPLLYFRLF